MEPLEMPDNAALKSKEEKFAKLVELGILESNPLDDETDGEEKDESFISVD